MLMQNNTNIKLNGHFIKFHLFLEKKLPQKQIL